MTRYKEILPQIDLLNMFFYLNGSIYWRYSPNNSVKKGDKVGYTDPRKYRIVKVNSYKMREHRVIWVMHYGAIPNGMQIDHINGVRDDNRIENLRLANDSQNHINSKLRHSNTSGYRGVSWNKFRKKWISRIKKDKKEIIIGAFININDAVAAYRKASVMLHGEYAKTAIEL